MKFFLNVFSISVFYTLIPLSLSLSQENSNDMHAQLPTSLVSHFQQHPCSFLKQHQHQHYQQQMRRTKRDVRLPARLQSPLMCSRRSAPPTLTTQPQSKPGRFRQTRNVYRGRLTCGTRIIQPSAQQGLPSLTARRASSACSMDHL